MTYPGNPALPEDARERISTTFEQTKELVGAGSLQEALAGCEFILRLDPLFSPARELANRLRADVESPPPPVGTSGAAASDQSELDELDDLDDLGDLDDLEGLEGLEDFDDLDDLGFDDQAAAPEEEPARPKSGLATMVADLLAKRQFEQIIQIADSQKDAIAADPDVLLMVAKARDFLESDAFVKSFLAEASAAHQDGRSEAAKAALRKAHELDPEHPDLFVLRQEIEGSEDLDLDSPGEVFVPPDAAADGLDDTRPVGLEVDPDLAIESPAIDSPEFGDLEDADQQPAGTMLIDGIDGFGEEEPALIPGGETVRLEGLESLAQEDDEVQLETGLLAELGGDDLTETTDSDSFLAGDSLEEEGDRVAQLIEEGRAAFEKEEYQAAIDVWSRIFLIDIDNQDAKDLIEEARNKKAELERKGEEVFHQGVALLEEGSLEEAADHFRSVLEVQPSHALAREYLDELDAGQVPTIHRLGGSDGDDDSLTLGEDLESAESSPSMEAAVERDRMVVVKKADRKLIALGAVVLLAVVGLGGFLVTSWDDLFPNSENSGAPGPRRVDAVARAMNMHESGNTENAILVLERIAAEDAQYEQAQALIAQWKALVEVVPEEEDTGLSPEDQARFDLLLEAARGSHGSRRFIRAQRYFERAAKLSPLEAEDLGLKRDTEENLKHLADHLDSFDQGDYKTIIPELWRLRESRPDDRDIQLLIVDSYYNLALTDLQRGDPQDAAVKLKEALEVDPDGRDLERLHLFAETYTRRDQDLLYRIFVKYLPSR